MKQYEKTVGLDEIKFSPDFYPRSKYSWITALEYSDAMKTGSIFPAVVVAKRGDELVLVDGKHRLEAMKSLKVGKTKVIVLEGLKDKEIYLEAVKRNMANGARFMPYDKVLIVQRLKKLDFDIRTISKVVNMPVDKLQSFVAKRLVTTPIGEVVLKRPLLHLAGQTLDHEIDQEVFIGGGQQVTRLREVNQMLEDGLIDLEKKSVIAELERLYKNLETVMATLR